jgi:hypothetical protein
MTEMSWLRFKQICTEAYYLSTNLQLCTYKYRNVPYIIVNCVQLLRTDVWLEASARQRSARSCDQGARSCLDWGGCARKGARSNALEDWAWGEGGGRNMEFGRIMSLGQAYLKADIRGLWRTEGEASIRKYPPLELPPHHLTYPMSRDLSSLTLLSVVRMFSLLASILLRRSPGPHSRSYEHFYLQGYRAL